MSVCETINKTSKIIEFYGVLTCVLRQASNSPVSWTFFQYGSSAININASTDYRLAVSAYPDALYDPVYLEISVPYDSISTVFSICRVELLSVGSNLPCVNQRKVNSSVTYFTTYVTCLAVCLSACR